MSDMDENTYQLIITNKISGDQDKNLIVQKLATLFKTSEQKAEQLLNKNETVVKSNIDKATAEKYLTAILKTGADCKITNTSEEKEQLELKDVNDFCPKCSTIKKSQSDICPHCGYDPKNSEVKNNNIRNASIITILATILIVIAYLFVLPFYNSYANKSKIENGLQLAYDTRDKITTIILETNFWPNQNIDANLPKQVSNDVIESLVVSKNAIFTVTLRAKVLKTNSGKTIIFKPSTSKGKLIWNCTKGTLNNEFRPDICKRNN